MFYGTELAGEVCARTWSVQPELASACEVLPVEAQPHEILFDLMSQNTCLARLFNLD
jgi:hypothetical protein